MYTYNRLKKLAGIKIVTEDAADDLNKWMDTPLASLGANPVEKLPADAKALAAKGQEDKNPKDDATITGGSDATDVALTDLRASQNEVGMNQSLANVLGGVNATWDGINWGDVNWLVEHMKPGATITFKSALLGALTKDGKVVLDGHHRWSQAFMLNPGAKVNVILANATNKSADETLKAVHLAILTKTGASNTKGAKGGNLFSAGESDIKKYLASASKVDPKTGKPSDTGVAPYVAAVMRFSNITDPAAGEAAAVKRVLDAIKVCAETVVKGAPSRDAMPQADNETNPIDASAAMDALASGTVNYSEPFVPKESKQSNKKVIQEMKKKKIQEAIETLKMKRIAKIISEAEYQKQLRLLEDAEEDLANVMKKDLAGAVADLKSLASKEDFNSIATKGTEDGDVADEKVPFGSDNPANTKMYPTQAEIGFGNSLDDIVNDQWGAIDSAFSEPVKMPSPDGKVPVLCASIGGKIAILDGHHRWSLCFMINPGATMACDIMEAPAGMDPENALKIMQLAIAAKAGKVVTKPFEGKDLMATSTEEVRKYILDNIGEKEVATFAKYRKDLNTKEAIADHIAEAHKKIVPMAGPFPRIIMPQAGKSETSQDIVNKALAAGEINFKEPFTAKESKQNSKFEAQLFEAVMKRSIAELGRAAKRKK